MTPLVPRFVFAGWLFSVPAAFATVHQGNGIKIGEVTAESAVIWTRLTTAPEACRRDIRSAYDARRALFGVR